ncbi:MAG: hypothetical protein R3C99_25360 [Pirellulaceae bacterium]|nr:hypothetical protein [Planctomycetales bacterium]MCA9224525.1 hypothetical protein [Planctomycetales bacterium]
MADRFIGADDPCKRVNSQLQECFTIEAIHCLVVVANLERFGASLRFVLEAFDVLASNP